jgi:two-component system response regulator
MSAERHNRKPNILLVEDNPGDVDLLRLAFANANLQCDLTVLEDGGEALALVRQEGKYAGMPAPDLAILDLNIPKNDGLEILGAMRANRVYANVPVAVFSSSSSPRERAAMESYNIRRFITKPSDLEEFMKIGGIVKALLEDRESGSTAV